MQTPQQHNTYFFTEEEITQQQQQQDLLLQSSSHVLSEETLFSPLQTGDDSHLSQQETHPPQYFETAQHYQYPTMEWTPSPATPFSQQYFASPTPSPVSQPTQQHQHIYNTTRSSSSSTPLPTFVTSKRKGTKKINFSSEERDLIVENLKDPKVKYAKKNPSAYEQFVFTFQINNQSNR